MTFLNSLVVLAAEVNIKMVTNSHFFKGHLNSSGPKVTFMIAKTVFAWKKSDFFEETKNVQEDKKDIGRKEVVKIYFKINMFSLAK
ncbi:TPA: hypothetical protein MI670_24895 [Klebsiella pneumoniae]|nr:hypothetical protein [Klebsiella pneumoniae]HBY7558632.1 hypothetical protein [Klebsiella pneumoniae]